ncbi:MAG: 30S ribosomal protein S8 [Bacteroidota bacterium]|nr:30S ribosomal protein S8 [Bacteroidota bacterium]MDP4204415.1 30S ribosomal protein S8 [Bacteroidota bacterium]
MTDPIADFLTRLRNAIRAKHRIVEIPASKEKMEIARILKEKGYILNYKFEETPNKQGVVKVALKYHPETRVPAIKSIVRISRPGLRRYVNSHNIPRVLNGLGIAVISTSRGVISDKEARALNVGGEVLCYVY